MFHISGYFRNSGSERSSLILSEIVFALGDVLSYINNRAFEQVGEFVKNIILKHLLKLERTAIVMERVRLIHLILTKFLVG